MCTCARHEQDMCMRITRNNSKTITKTVNVLTKCLVRNRRMQRKTTSGRTLRSTRRKIVTLKIEQREGHAADWREENRRRSRRQHSAAGASLTLGMDCENSCNVLLVNEAQRRAAAAVARAVGGGSGVAATPRSPGKLTRSARSKRAQTECERRSRSARAHTQVKVW